MTGRLLNWIFIPVLLTGGLFIILVEGLLEGDPYVLINFGDTYYVITPWVFLITCFSILLSTSLVIKFFLLKKENN